MAASTSIALLFLTVFTFFAFTAGETKHCYVCKSRGDQGDCKDPYNMDAGRINIQPCFTGWCMKTLDTEENFPATVRTCMNSPPDDNTARCTAATDGLPGFPKKVYVCYCKGNLCNSGIESRGKAALMIGAGLLLLLF